MLKTTKPAIKCSLTRAIHCTLSYFSRAIENTSAAVCAYFKLCYYYIPVGSNLGVWRHIVNLQVPKHSALTRDVVRILDEQMFSVRC